MKNISSPHQRPEPKHRRRGFTALLGLGLATWLCAIPTAHAERTLTDMAGRTVRLPDKIRQVYAVGHCIPLVGALAPEKLANNYRLGTQAKAFLPPVFFEGKATPASGTRFSDEEIVRMGADLVIMEAMPGATERADRLAERLHVPVVLVDQDLLKSPQAFTFLGEVLGHPEQARLLSDFFHTYLEPIRAKALSIPEARRVKVYYAEGPDGLSTNPAGSSHTQVLEFVGGRNAAQVSNLPDEGMSTVSLEQLYLWQPDLILVWTPNADQLTTWRAITTTPLWQKVEAVSKGRVVQIPWLPFSWFDRPPGSNRILGVLWLAKILYPEIYQFDLVAVTREYFRSFYHRELSEAEARYLLNLAHPPLHKGTRQ